jgi:hypothetical protein
MSIDFVHNDPEFPELIGTVAFQHELNAGLVEKDYWIMHTLYSLQKMGLEFELKGGTSLSKGYGLINRFSEDIDLHVRTNFGYPVEGNAEKKRTQTARQAFYDHLKTELYVPGATFIERDHAFDDLQKFRSGGIRIGYPVLNNVQGLKSGILLEVGFDQVTPNIPKDITSWISEYLNEKSLTENYIDNRALQIPCYHPGYTFVEKLQTIVRKYNQYRLHKTKPSNFLRHYYDLYCLLNLTEIQSFLHSPEYQLHKQRRFKGTDRIIPLSEHPAFSLSLPGEREEFQNQLNLTANLYYRGLPNLNTILDRIQTHQHKF